MFYRNFLSLNVLENRFFFVYYFLLTVYFIIITLSCNSFFVAKK